MILPPPTSTLFPYTTLFRSSRSARWGENVQTPGPGPLTRSRGFISQRHVSGFTLITSSNSEIGRAHSELQSPMYLVCRLLLEKKKKKIKKKNINEKK